MNFLKDINTISSVRYNVINPYILPEWYRGFSRTL
jgi:hypothetical protein